MLLFPFLSIFVCLFLCLFCSSPPKSNPLNKFSTEREIPLTSYLLCPTRMSFFVGREMVGVRSQTFHLHRKHRAFCPCWMSLVRRSSSEMMGECERLEIRRCSSPKAVRMTESKKVEWNERNEVICLCLLGNATHHHNVAISDMHTQRWSKLCLCIYCAPLNVIHPIRICAVWFIFVLSLLLLNKVHCETYHYI